MNQLRNLFLLLIAGLMVSYATAVSDVTKIIFDTDLGGDADDLGALIMLHNFAKKGECEVLAVMCWSLEEHSVAAVDVVNRFYGQLSVPIGTRKGETWYIESQHGKIIAETFPHEQSHQTVPDATKLYRKVLAAQADGSVTIVTVGPLKNIMNLLQSGPDVNSPLNGKELISKKVKEFVIMGGHFPEGKNEWNFNGNMPGVTRYVIKEIPVPITFTGFEVGVNIKTGVEINDTDPNTPLYVGYRHFSENAPWMKQLNFEGRILPNSTYDQTAVLYAVRGGVGEYWERVDGGYCEVDENGDNRWINGEKTNQSYLRLLANPEEMGELIGNMMLNRF